MTRREFLIGTAGFVVLAAGGWKVLSSLSNEPSVNAENATGPLLADNLRFTETSRGADVYLDDEKVFEVNGKGYELLKLADGKNTLDRIIEISDTKKIAASTAMFFVTLGKAGYLQNRVEVCLYEVKV